MIRFINCLRRREDLSVADFRQFWTDPTFDRLIARAVETTGAESVTRSLTLDIELNDWVADVRGTGDRFDGVLEYHWKKGEHLAALRGTPELQALQVDMDTFQRQFVDFSRSVAFFAETA